MIRLALAILLAALTLFLPAPWCGAALIACALLAARIFADRQACPHKDPDWDFSPEDLRPEDCEGLLIDPHALTEGRAHTARVWMGTQAADGAKFRSLPGAPLFSAAAALTEAETLALTGGSAGDPDALKSLRAWQTALGIRPDRLRAQFPRVEDAKIDDFHGAVVRDGAQERAYFVGTPALMKACTLILDDRGQTRPILAGDRRRAEALPADLVCYATSLVEDGKLAGLTWLGGAEPIVSWKPRIENIAAAQALSERIPLYYDRADKDAEAIAAALMPSLPPARGTERLVRVTARGGAGAKALPSPEVIDDWRLHSANGRFRALALCASALAAALPACAALCAGSPGIAAKLPALLAALLPCAGYFLCEALALRPARRQPTAVQLMLSLLPPLASALLLALLVGTVDAGTLLRAGITAAWGIGLLPSLFFTSAIRDDETRKRAELIAIAIGCAVLALILVALCPLPAGLLGLLFGAVLGLLCGILRQLIARI